MKANQRFALTASAVTGILFAGTFAALVSVEDGAQVPPMLRPAQVPIPVSARAEATRAPKLTAPRFAYVPPEIGILTAPPDGGVSARPAMESGTWAVDVRKTATHSEVASPSSSRDNVEREGIKSAKHRRRPVLAKRLAQISPRAKRRLLRKFEAVKATWPPREVAFVAFKDEKVLDLYARALEGGWTFVHRYPVLAASGRAGPKLRQGDRQVPEGVYRINYLNPTSRYHVSLRLNYPNAFDRKMAAVDKRRGLGGDIMIHGKNLSAGCLAMGDAAAEELFVLIAEVGKSRARVVIAPTDFRRQAASRYPTSPPWLPTLYTKLAGAISEFPPPPRPGLLSLLWP